MTTTSLKSNLTQQSRVTQSSRPRRSGITWRSLLISVLIIPLNAYWVVQMEDIRYTAHPTTVSLFFNAVFILLVCTAANAVFARKWPGRQLTQPELLAMYSMAILPVRWAGVALILFAIGLFIADVKVPSHGFLTAGGIISFIVGALMLVETQYSQILQVSWLTIVSLTVLVAGFFIFAIGAAVRAHRRKVTTGREGMIGERGRARSALTPEGSVFVAGEIWRARAADGAPISEGEAVEVMGLDGFTLLVRRSGARPS